jgi:hypothetical protein
MFLDPIGLIKFYTLPFHSLLRIPLYSGSLWILNKVKAKNLTLLQLKRKGFTKLLTRVHLRYP